MMNRRRFLMNMGMGIALVAMAGCAAYVPTKRGVIQMGGDSSVVGEILNGMFAPMPDQGQAQQQGSLNINFQRVECGHGVFYRGDTGMMIETDALVKYMAGREIILAAFFFRENGQKVMSQNPRYSATDGQFHTYGEIIAVGQDSEMIRGYRLFTPNSEIENNCPNGRYYFYVEGFDASSKKVLGRSSNTIFNVGRI
jgi:hypothetical protein